MSNNSSLTHKRNMSFDALSDYYSNSQSSTPFSRQAKIVASMSDRITRTSSSVIDQAIQSKQSSTFNHLSQSNSQPQLLVSSPRVSPLCINSQTTQSPQLYRNFQMNSEKKVNSQQEASSSTSQILNHVDHQQLIHKQAIMLKMEQMEKALGEIKSKQEKMEKDMETEKLLNSNWNRSVDQTLKNILNAVQTMSEKQTIDVCHSIEAMRSEIQKNNTTVEQVETQLSSLSSQVQTITENIKEMKDQNIEKLDKVMEPNVSSISPPPSSKTYPILGKRKMSPPQLPLLEKSNLVERYLQSQIEHIPSTIEVTNNTSSCPDFWTTDIEEESVKQAKREKRRKLSQKY
jgi:hypothetical protein